VRRFPHRNRLFRLPPDPDLLDTPFHRDPFPAEHHLLPVHPLEEEVRIIQHHVGESPGNFGIVTDDHGGGAREGDPVHIHPGSDQVDLVPEGWTR
jgi:hypothetical protein